MATKQETLNSVISILESNKIKETDKLYVDLINLLSLKKGGKTNEFPPKLDKDGNIKEIYCAWHKEYEPIEEFAISKKSSTGYHYECKEASKEWQKYTKFIKVTKESINSVTNDILNEDITLEEAKVKVDELKQNIADAERYRSDKIDYLEFETFMAIQS